MRCSFEDSDSGRAEQAIVDAWISATECSGVSEIIVEHDAVILRGTRPSGREVSGTALRHGDLFAELSDALAVLRRPSDNTGELPVTVATMTPPSTSNPHLELDYTTTT